MRYHGTHGTYGTHGTNAPNGTHVTHGMAANAERVIPRKVRAFHDLRVQIRAVRGCLLLAVTLAVAAPAAAATHDVAFWRAIVQAKFAPPENAVIPALAGELVDWLSSSDPERRDDIAYSTLT